MQLRLVFILQTSEDASEAYEQGMAPSGVIRANLV